MRGGTIPAARLLQWPSGRGGFQLHGAAARIVRRPMPTFAYRYELRRGEEVLATGHLTYEHQLEVGERITIGGLVGIVRAIEPVVGGREFRLVAQVWRERIEPEPF